MALQPNDVKKIVSQKEAKLLVALVEYIDKELEANYTGDSPVVISLDKAMEKNFTASVFHELQELYYGWHIRKEYHQKDDVTCLTFLAKPV